MYLFPLHSQKEFPPSEIKTAGIEESKVLNATMDDSSQNKQVVPDYDDVVSLVLHYKYMFSTI